MANVRTIALNGNGGDYTTISATQVTRRVEIIEDYSANGGVGQGLEYNLPDPASGNPGNPSWIGPLEIAPQTEPIILGEPIPQGAGYAPTLGQPAQESGGYSLDATPLIQIRSATATGTTVRVTEFS